MPNFFINFSIGKLILKAPAVIFRIPFFKNKYSQRKNLRGNLGIVEVPKSRAPGNNMKKYGDIKVVKESVELDEMTLKPKVSKKYPDRTSDGFEGPYASGQRAGRMFYYDTKADRFYDADSTEFKKRLKESVELGEVMQTPEQRHQVYHELALGLIANIYGEDANMWRKVVKDERWIDSFGDKVGPKINRGLDADNPGTVEYSDQQGRGDWSFVMDTLKGDVKYVHKRKSGRFKNTVEFGKYIRSVRESVELEEKVVKGEAAPFVVKQRDGNYVTQTQGKKIKYVGRELDKAQRFTKKDAEYFASRDRGSKVIELDESVELDEAWNADSVKKNAEIGSKSGYGINIKKRGAITKAPYKHMLMTTRSRGNVRVTFDHGKNEFEGTPKTINPSFLYLSQRICKSVYCFVNPQ